jgi:hypothetical protein
MSNSDAAIREAVDAFVEQLSRLIKQAALDSVQSLLSSSAPRGQGGSKANRGSLAIAATRGKGAKRTPDELEALTKKLHVYVTNNPGQRIEQIGKALAVATKELALPVKKLIGEKRVSTKGQKRATTYFGK